MTCSVVRYLDDGRIELDNLIAERGLRPVAIGRRNYLFAGSDEGGSYCPSRHLLINRGSIANYSHQAWGERLGQPASVKSVGLVYFDDKCQPTLRCHRLPDNDRTQDVYDFNVFVSAFIYSMSRAIRSRSPVR